MSELRISGLISESIVDGEGLRFVVFTQGCPHNCPGCHNPETHAMDGGSLTDVGELAAQILENPLLDGVTFSGGEPFLQAEALAELGAIVKQGGLDIVTYTGYLYEDLIEAAKSDAAIAALLAVTDILIDGPYVEELRDLSLDFRGSSNQRIIRIEREA